MDRIKQLTQRARMGDLTDAERAELESALLGLAPSSQEYRNIYSALGGLSDNSSLPTNLPEVERPIELRAGVADRGNGTGIMHIPEWNPGFPTMDWAAGIGDFMQGNFGNAGTGGGSYSQEGPFSEDERLPVWHLEDAPSPATVSDTQGSLPQGSGVEISETGKMGFPTPPGGWGPVANSLYTAGMPDMDDIADVDINQFPEGYSFSGGDESSVEMLAASDTLWARQQAERAGTPNMAAFLEPRTKASMQMASLGLIGEDSGIPGLGSGPSTATGRLAASEDFMKQFDAPGVQFVDPSQIWEGAFQKAEETPWQKMISPSGSGQLMTPFEVVEATNNALLTSMAFSTEDTASWAESLLNNAAQEYILKIANGELSSNISYPAYLRSQGFSDLLRGNK